MCVTKKPCNQKLLAFILRVLGEKAQKWGDYSIGGCTLRFLRVFEWLSCTLL